MCGVSTRLFTPSKRAPEAAVTGVYKLRAAQGEADGTVVLQGSGVAYAFIQDALPLLESENIDLDVFYIASAELFDLLPDDQKHSIFPESRAREAMGITGFTLPTMFRWIRSDRGRAHTLHPYRRGHYLGSGPGPMVLAEAGLDGQSQAMLWDSMEKIGARQVWNTYGFDGTGVVIGGLDTGVDLARPAPGLAALFECLG